MVITSPDGVLRVNPDPCQEGNLVVNGSRLIARLPPQTLGRHSWAGWAYREHRCWA